MKYEKINSKNNQLRLKNLRNNDFPVNGFQILTPIKQNNGLPYSTFGIVTVSVNF